MATLNFYLDKADKGGKSFIIMTYFANGQKFRHSVKIKLFPAQWQINKQRLKIKSVEDEFLNGHLDGLEEIITSAQRESLLTHNEINFNFIKQKFYDSLGGKQKVTKTLLECFKEYIDESRNTKGIKTTHRYICCLNHLLQFKKVTKYEMSFEKINLAFYENFISYLMHSKKLLNNTVGSYVKTFKAFMNFCTERGLCKPNTEVKRFKVLKEDTELIYLSEAELLTIYELRLTSDKLNVVRENFCFACFTGLRYSDIQKLQIENIKPDYIEIRTEKTRDYLKIPLNSYAKAILARNEGKLPNLYSNQKTNAYLKELGELAELTESIHIVKYRGVEKVEFTEPKYKFLCTHTARRTFVTL